MSKSGTILGFCRICYDNIYEGENRLLTTNDCKVKAHAECFYDMLEKIKKVRSVLDE